ncbi:MAG TPA: hypothetical protein VE573_07005 [Nitrososphaeraceae archaeon]|jgi:hypothetical protein|nr:hypothetical protein [Nitrososphaeraceae archaeon]
MNSQYEKGKRIRIIPIAMSTSILLLLLLSLVPSSTLYPNAAFGDGLFMEELSASFGDRKADLIIKMTPPVVTTETLQNQNQKPVIQFKLYDPTTKEGYKHVTYYITIEKDGKKLLSDWFHDHKGDLKIEMKPSTAEQIAVYGEPDPILQAFTGTENSPVVATGPIFSEGGLYHFIVRITTIDFDRSFIPDDKQPVYDGWLSVGSTVNQQVSLSDGEQIPIQVISYYDDIKDFNFDSSNKQIQFTMPFNWNITRLEDQKQLMVHQEVSIPKGTPLTSQSYTGAINGIDVTKSLMVDPSNSTKNVVHFMLPKPAVIQIAEEVNNNGNAAVSNGLMEFSLSPSTNASSSSMHDMTNMAGM